MLRYYIKDEFTFVFWQLAFDEFEGRFDAVVVGDIEQESDDSLRCLRFDVLRAFRRQARGEDVDAPSIELAGDEVTETSVASRDENVPL